MAVVLNRENIISLVVTREDLNLLLSPFKMKNPSSEITVRLYEGPDHNPDDYRAISLKSYIKGDHFGVWLCINRAQEYDMILTGNIYKYDNGEQDIIEKIEEYINECLYNKNDDFKDFFAGTQYNFTPIEICIYKETIHKKVPISKEMLYDLIDYTFQFYEMSSNVDSISVRKKLVELTTKNLYLCISFSRNTGSHNLFEMEFGITLDNISSYIRLDRRYVNRDDVKLHRYDINKMVIRFIASAVDRLSDFGDGSFVVKDEESNMFVSCKLDFVLEG